MRKFEQNRQQNTIDFKTGSSMVQTHSYAISKIFCSHKYNYACCDLSQLVMPAFASPTAVLTLSIQNLLNCVACFIQIFLYICSQKFLSVLLTRLICLFKI